MSIHHTEIAYFIQHAQDGPICINVMVSGKSSIWDLSSLKLEELDKHLTTVNLSCSQHITNPRTIRIFLFFLQLLL